MKKLKKQDLERIERTELTYQALGGEFNTSAALGKKLGFPQSRVQKYLSAMEAVGRVFRVTRKCSQVNWFKTQQEADEFRKAALRAVKQAKTAPLPPTVMLKAASFSKGAQIVVPAHVKPQECPPFKGLGFADEPSKVVGGWATMGVGRYLADEDRRLARKAA